jgi:hypothetical protein
MVSGDFIEEISSYDLGENFGESRTGTPERWLAPPPRVLRWTLCNTLRCHMSPPLALTHTDLANYQRLLELASGPYRNLFF